MLLIADTDVITLLQHESQPAFDRLRAKLQGHPSAEVVVTVVSYQEQTQGWLAEINRARKPEAILDAYEGLQATLAYFRSARVLPFDAAAQQHFAALRKQRVRIGTQDLRIACIALANEATLLSRNLRDFRQVPGLTVEDWIR